MKQNENLHEAAPEVDTEHGKPDTIAAKEAMVALRLRSGLEGADQTKDLKANSQKPQSGGTREDQIFNRLEGVLRVSDVMIPADRLITAPSLDEARKIHETRRFYVIPITENGKITKYHVRGEEILHDISEARWLKPSSQILDLIDLLVDDKFCFVGDQGVIAGFVHFSDLNGHVVKIMLFALVENLERHLCELLDNCRDFTEDAITNFLVKNGSKIVKAYHKQVKRDADIGLACVLRFCEVLTMASGLKLLSLDEVDIRRLNEFRNRICHAPKPLVGEHKDVKDAAWARDKCLSLAADN